MDEPIEKPANFTKDNGGREIRHLWDDMFTTSTVLAFAALVGLVIWAVWVYVFGF